MKLLGTWNRWITSVCLERSTEFSVIHQWQIPNEWPIESYCKRLINQTWYCNQSLIHFPNWDTFDLYGLTLIQSVLTVLLNPLNHVHVKYVSPQLRCVDTCHIWTWYLIEKQCLTTQKKGNLMSYWIGLVILNHGDWFCRVPVHFMISDIQRKIDNSHNIIKI